MDSLEACVSISKLTKFFSFLVDFQFNCFVVPETPLYDFNTLKFDETAWVHFYQHSVYA